MSYLLEKKWFKHDSNDPAKFSVWYWLRPFSSLYSYYAKKDIIHEWIVELCIMKYDNSKSDYNYLSWTHNTYTYLS